MIYLLTAIGLSPGGSNTHLHTNNTKNDTSGFGGAEVACWPLIPMFAGSNPAEAVGFLKGDKKSSARLLSEGK